MSNPLDVMLFCYNPALLAHIASWLLAPGKGTPEQSPQSPQTVPSKASGCHYQPGVEPGGSAYGLAKGGAYYVDRLLIQMIVERQGQGALRYRLGHWKVTRLVAEGTGIEGLQMERGKVGTAGDTLRMQGSHHRVPVDFRGKLHDVDESTHAGGIRRQIGG